MKNQFIELNEKELKSIEGGSEASDAINRWFGKMLGYFTIGSGNYAERPIMIHMHY